MDDSGFTKFRRGFSWFPAKTPGRLSQISGTPPFITTQCAQIGPCPPNFPRAKRSGRDCGISGRPFPAVSVRSEVARCSLRVLRWRGGPFSVFFPPVEVRPVSNVRFRKKFGISGSRSSKMSSIDDFGISGPNFERRNMGPDGQNLAREKVRACRPPVR